MQIKISNEALNWYTEELDLKSGSQVRFFARYGGQSPIQKGFSLGIVEEAATTPAVAVNYNGITFFIEESDVWYFDGHDLTVDFNDDINEPEFKYEKIQQ